MILTEHHPKQNQCKSTHIQCTTTLAWPVCCCCHFSTCSMRSHITRALVGIVASNGHDVSFTWNWRTLWMDWKQKRWNLSINIFKHSNWGLQGNLKTFSTFVHLCYVLTHSTGIGENSSIYQSWWFPYLKLTYPVDRLKTQIYVTYQNSLYSTIYEATQSYFCRYSIGCTVFCTEFI